MSIHILAANLPGLWSQQGIVEKVSGQERLTIPAFAGEIGGRGLRLKQDTEFDPIANSDGTFTTLDLGDDIYWYVVHPSTPGLESDIVFSKNSTIPSGFTAQNSRKRGGFHVGRRRAMADRYNDTATISTGILDNSVWCSNNRPYPASPEGMAKLPSGIWMDIYLASSDGGAWPDEKHISMYNQLPWPYASGYIGRDYVILVSRSGKRLPTFFEWLEGAYGSPKGHSGDNNAAWTATGNSNGTYTGSVEQALSVHGIVDCVGNYLELTSDIDFDSGTISWQPGPTQGAEPGDIHGNFLAPSVIYSILAGSRYNYGSNVGDTSLGRNNCFTSLVTASGSGFRGVCSPITV